MNLSQCQLSSQTGGYPSLRSVKWKLLVPPWWEASPILQLFQVELQMGVTSITGLVYAITRGNIQLQGVTSHPMGWGIFPVLSCHRNRDKPRLVGPLAPVQTFPCFTINTSHYNKKAGLFPVCLFVNKTYAECPDGGLI